MGRLVAAQMNIALVGQVNHGFALEEQIKPSFLDLFHFLKQPGLKPVHPRKTGLALRLAKADEVEFHGGGG
jgi:hypothetical protein